MSELNNRAEFSHYDSMTTEELQEILRKHANGELQTEPDTDELYYIMEVLARRREVENPQAFRSDEEALAEFRKHYMPKEKKAAKVIKFPSRALKAVAAVLAVVIIFAVGTSITAKAFHIDIWSKFANWTKEIFQFTDLPQGTKPENPEQENNVELASLQEALAQHEVTERIAPTWMPEGYSNRDLQVMATPRVLNISAIYEENETELIIKIRRTIGVQAPQVEKNDDFLELYVVDGVEYYIFSNTETINAAWSIGVFDCMITGKITVEEMKTMFDSIR